MAYEIIYIPKQPTWKGKPGRLHIPTPRDANEAGEAVKTLLARGDVEQITIIPVIEKPKK